MKPRTDLLDANFLMQMASVLASGAAKHGERGWETRTDLDDHYRAVLSHLLRWRRGDGPDEESGESHLLHAAVRIMIIRILEDAKTIKMPVISVGETYLDETSLDETYLDETYGTEVSL